MTRLLIRSDRLVIRSDGNTRSFIFGLAQTSQTARARLAADRATPARHIGRDIQALWSAELPLRRWPGHGPKRYLSISQPGGRPRRDYVPNNAHLQVAQLIDNFRKLRQALDEICAINAELLRRREDLG